MSHAADLGEQDQLDLVVDAAIVAAGSDARVAILNLVRRQHELTDAMERTVSAGYVRRRPAV